MIDPAIVGQLRKKLDDARLKVRVGRKYYYHSIPNVFYTVTDLALIQGEGVSNADLEVYVVFRSNSPDFHGMSWTRPVDQFIGRVEYKGKMIPRFILA